MISCVKSFSVRARIPKGSCIVRARIPKGSCIVRARIPKGSCIVHSYVMCIASDVTFLTVARWQLNNHVAYCHERFV